MSRTPVRALCAAALLLAGTARAEEQAAAPEMSVNDRLDLIEVKQKDAVMAGDVPGSFRVPGTELSIRLYGWAELNWIHDFKGDTADIDFSTFPYYVPLRDTVDGNRTQRDMFTGRTSRFGLDASQPTRYGALAAKIEGDFANEPRTGGTEQYGTSRNVITQQQTSSYGFRLRHAYGTYAGFLAGQTWGTFMDVDNSPETVDFNGPMGSTIIRQPMIRYTYATQSFGASRYTIALENSSSYVLSPTNGLPLASSLSRFPDVVLRWDASFEWGNVSVRGLTQEFRVKGEYVTDTTTGATAPIAVSKRGYGAAATAFVKMRGGADYLSVGVTGGDGLGRYMNYTEGAVYDPVRDEIALERTVGVVAGYQFKWSPQLRVNFVYGIQRTFNDDFTRTIRELGFDSGRFGINRMVQQAHVGPIFTPIPGLDVGVEGIWGQRETLAKEHGDLIRTDVMVRYYIN